MSDPMPVPRRYEERRLVTCLFVDIVGSTPLTVALGPERLKRALDEAFTALRLIIVAEGGTVEKYVGDAVYALFGAPTAHSDDPLRALRAAHAAARWAEAGQDELVFALRLGIETGEAIVDLAAAERSHQQMSVGAVVNTAARLQQRAEPGEILVGPVCHDATRDAAEFAALGTVPLKGLGDLAVWRFLGLRAAAEAPALPFVGRDSEVSLLEFALGRARAGRSVLAIVSGPPGQGKTALIREFLRRTGLADRTLLARCRPGAEGGVLSPLRQLLGLGETDGIAELRADIGARYSDPRERDRVAAALAQSAGIAVSPELTQLGAVELADELVNGWRRYLATLVGEEPAVLWVEDLHWADPSVVKLIDRLTLGGERLLLLATARPEFAESAGLRPSGDRFFIELEGLEAEAAAALGASAGHLAGAALERAQGNPLFIVALARSDPGTDEELPLTLRGALGARLDELEPAAREVLGHGAIVGETFTAADAALLSGRAVAEVSPVLARLADRQYLVELGGAYRFHHSLLRDVAYGRLLAAERMRLHATYAREGVHPEDAEALARHWGEALRPPDAEWVWKGSPELPAMRRSAFTTHLAAGRLHTEHRLIDPALELLARAITYAETPRDTALAERALGAAYYRTLRCDEAWDHLQRALAIHRAAGSVPLPLYLELIDVARKSGAFREPPDRSIVHALLDDAEAAARAAADRPALVRILIARIASGSDPQATGLPEARALAETAGDADLLAGVLVFEISTRGLGGDIAAIVSATGELERLVERGAVADRGDPTLPLALGSWAALLGGDLDRADALADAAIERGTHLGPHLRTHAATAKSDVLLAAGRWVELIDLAGWTRQIVLAHRDSAFCVAAALTLCYGGSVHALEGRRDEARSTLVPIGTMTVGDAGPFLLALPQAFLGEDVALVSAAPPFLDPWLQQVHRIWISLAVGDEAAAHAAVDALEAGAQGGSPVLTAFVTVARARLAGETTRSGDTELDRLGYRGWSRFLGAQVPGPR